MSKAAFVPTSVPPADLTSGPAGADQHKTNIGLLHAALSRMAFDIGTEGGTVVATQDIVQVLGQDLADTVFDGQQASGVPILLLGKVPITVETTRWELARAADAFIGDKGQNASGLTYDDLAGDAGFYTRVSTDTGPLYPAGAPVKRYDTRPPALAFTEPTPAEGQTVGATFFAGVAATDDSALEALAMTSPVGAAVASATTDLATGVLQASIAPGELPDGPFTVAVSATDVSGNTAAIERTLIADTTPPSCVFVSPAAETWTNQATLPVVVQSADATAGGVSVVVSASGVGVDAVESVVGWEAEVALAGEVTVLEATCTDALGNVASTEILLVHLDRRRRSLGCCRRATSSGPARAGRWM